MTNRRTRLLSLAGAIVLVVLITTAVAVLMTSSSGPSAPLPLGEQKDPYGLSTFSQPGVSPSSGSSRPAISPSSPPTASPKASYRTVALLGLGGFDTEVTVRSAQASWTVVLTMPDDKTAVENRSPAVVKMVQKGSSVTLTPVSSPDVQFTVRFPALLALGKSITACTIDGRACDAA